MDDLFNAIFSLGFPTVVSIYLLVRFETKITNLAKTINSLEKTIEKMNIRVNTQ